MTAEEPLADALPFAALYLREAAATKSIMPASRPETAALW